MSKPPINSQPLTSNQKVKKNHRRRANKIRNNKLSMMMIAMRRKNQRKKKKNLKKIRRKNPKQSMRQFREIRLSPKPMRKNSKRLTFTAMKSLSMISLKNQSRCCWNMKESNLRENCSMNLRINLNHQSMRFSINSKMKNFLSSYQRNKRINQINSQKKNQTGWMKRIQIAGNNTKININS